MTNFISLHNQTHFSLLDSLIAPKDLFNRAKELGQPAVAITDHGSFAAIWEARKLSKDTGVKLIVGCECYFANDASQKDSGDKLRHIILIAKNAVGYRNLLTINKKGFDQGYSTSKHVYPTIDWNLLKEYADGMICLTACGNGIVSQLLMNRKHDEAEKTILKLKDIFGDNLGIEIQPNNMKRGSNAYNDEIDQVFLNKQLYNLGKKHNVRVVAACNAHYVMKEDYKTHDVLLAIGSHQTVYSNFRLRYPVDDFYLKSGNEVKSFFTRNYGEAAAQEFCDNSVYFSDLCEQPDWVDPKFSNPSGKELPSFTIAGEPDEADFMKWRELQSEEDQKLAEDKLYLRFKCAEVFNKIVPEGKEKEYQDRLVEELDVLEFHGFSSYMLIVADLIKWAKKNNISIGEGRGSVGGSLVGYLLGIHSADPIKYNLIFARFHNKEKTSFPDIDTDIAPSKRGLVHEYLKVKYGKDHFAHVSNINTVTPKVYVRDIARACELGGSKDEAVKIGNAVADCIPKDIHSIDSALAKVPLFAEYCLRYPEFISYKQIAEKPRSWSTHAGGIIISARPMVGLVPLRVDKDGATAVEYGKDIAEENGLVKIDTLGLATLDVIDNTLDLIKLSNKELPKISYDEYDQLSYDLISSGDTYGVFQLGTSGGTIDLCRRIKPKSLNDISYINSLSRPSARDMRTDFIATKDGKRPFSLLHPKLARAFDNTFGFGLYEESLMILAQDIAGWNLHSADRLRKLTKEKGKNPKKVQAWRLEFINDAVKNGVNELIATRIWDEIINNFQGYGFNMSHSIMYSMTSYKTAYLKAHYPIEFLLANLIAQVKSNHPSAPLNIDKIKKEIRQKKVKIAPPDINKSLRTYTLESENKLITGLDAIKFVSDDAILDILQKRPFNDFFDFMHRVSSKTVRANSIQALSASGALDGFGISRKLMFLYCSDYRKKLQSWLKKHDATKEKFEYPWPKNSEWTKQELFALETHYIGEGLVCKPAVAYGDFFNDPHVLARDVKKAKEKSTVKSMRGIIKDSFQFSIKKEGSKNYGKIMVKATVEDKSGDSCSITIFPEQWEKIQKRIKDINRKAVFGPGLAIHFSGTTNNYEDDIGVIVWDLFNIALPPAMPNELKSQKISIKNSKDKKVIDKEIIFNNPKDLESHMEDMLHNEGLIDLNDEEGQND